MCIMNSEMGTGTCGFKELNHTADVAVKVWGDSIQALFFQAALALFAIAGVRDEVEVHTTSKIMDLHLRETDMEALLIAFLTEMLYYLGDGILFNPQEISIQGNSLEAKLIGKDGVSVQREVKAITYHHLQIEFYDDIYKTEIVFDV